MLRWGLGGLTLAGGLLLLRELRAAKRVPRLTPLPPDPALPPVAVLIPARDEARRIPRLLAGLATQTHRRFEVVVLDDHSTDATASVVSGAAHRLPHLRVVPSAPVPPGWAGKCWACWQAAQLVAAPWLLFLDADTAPAPALLASLLPYAVAHELDLLSLLPLLELETFWERLVLPPFVSLIHAAFPLDAVNDPQSPIALANGQCLLVKRDVYFASGGHRAVRDSVLEDTALGQRLKAQGYRLRVAAAPELLHVRMYTGGREVAQGLQKNVWAGYAAGGGRSAWAGVRQALLACGPGTLLAVGAWRGCHGRPHGREVVAWGLLWWALTTGYWGYMLRQVYRLHPLWALLYPVGTVCYFALAGGAWVRLRWGRGVTWKGRRYPAP